jgi:hypothetical protein
VPYLALAGKLPRIAQQVLQHSAYQARVALRQQIFVAGKYDAALWLALRQVGHDAPRQRAKHHRLAAYIGIRQP